MFIGEVLQMGKSCNCQNCIAALFIEKLAEKSLFPWHLAMTSEMLFPLLI